jgi:hypothetical protein
MPDTYPYVTPDPARVFRLDRNVPAVQQSDDALLAYLLREWKKEFAHISGEYAKELAGLRFLITEIEEEMRRRASS